MDNEHSHIKAKNFFLTLSALAQAIGAIILAIVTILAFTFATNPDLNPLNTNHFEKANAGSSNSQLFLAHHYYEFGDFVESVYWYKLASANDRNPKHQAIALNNLGYLYAMNYGISETVLNEKYRSDNAISLFWMASELNNEKGSINYYILWKTSPQTFFNRDREYQEHFDLIESNLKESGAYEKNKLADIGEQWIYTGTETFVSELARSDEQTRYIFRSSQTTRENAGTSATARVYAVYKLVEEDDYIIPLKYDYEHFSYSLGFPTLE